MVVTVPVAGMDVILPNWMSEAPFIVVPAV
jgi:hypothetical protein